METPNQPELTPELREKIRTFMRAVFATEDTVDTRTPLARDVFNYFGVEHDTSFVVWGPILEARLPEFFNSGELENIRGAVERQEEERARTARVRALLEEAENVSREGRKAALKRHADSVPQWVRQKVKPEDDNLTK